MTARKAPPYLYDERFVGILRVQSWYHSCALTILLLVICIAAIFGTADRDLVVALVALSAIGALCAFTARGLGRRKRTARILSCLLSVPLVPMLVGIVLICQVRKASRHGWFSSGPLPPLVVTRHQAELLEMIHLQAIDLGTKAVAHCQDELGIQSFTTEELAELEKRGRGLHLDRTRPLPWPLKVTTAALAIGIIPIVSAAFLDVNPVILLAGSAILLMHAAFVVPVAFTVLRGLGRDRWADDLWRIFWSSVLLCAVLGFVFAPIAIIAAPLSSAASVVLVVVLLVIGNS